MRDSLLKKLLFKKNFISFKKEDSGISNCIKMWSPYEKKMAIAWSKENQMFSEDVIKE